MCAPAYLPWRQKRRWKGVDMRGSGCWPLGVGRKGTFLGSAGPESEGQVRGTICESLCMGMTCTASCPRRHTSAGIANQSTGLMPVLEILAVGPCLQASVLRVM